jgi:hypothetical protein
MPDTFQLISSYTATGSVSSIDFTSIPSTYTDLCVQMSMRNGRGGQNLQEAFITFNGSTSGYSERYLRGSGSAAVSGSGSGTSFNLNGFPAGSSTASTFGSASLYIPNYAGSTNKSVSAEFMTENNGTEAFTYINALLWSNTAAITSISLSAGAYTWVQYSTAYLYGISKS